MDGSILGLNAMVGWDGNSILKRKSNAKKKSCAQIVIHFEIPKSSPNKLGFIILVKLNFQLYTSTLLATLQEALTDRRASRDQLGRRPGRQCRNAPRLPPSRQPCRQCSYSKGLRPNFIKIEKKDSTKFKQICSEVAENSLWYNRKLHKKSPQNRPPTTIKTALGSSKICNAPFCFPGS
jgi:hypothetical protein